MVGDGTPDRNRRGAQGCDPSPGDGATLQRACNVATIETGLEDGRGRYRRRCMYTTGGHPVLVIVPTDDRAFEAFVRSVVGEDRVTPDILQGRVRQRYPDAVVRPRQLQDEPMVIWYVYRDGRWRPASEHYGGAHG
jgi:hypothetical protein